jgi:3-oxoacyl-[acyl-carrier-protein] synthase III
LKARIEAIEYYLPESVLTNQDLAEQFPDWSVDKIQGKTGILQRHIAGHNECASDLAVRASEKLFSETGCSPKDIDYILLCTQSPDYFLPTTACIVQHRLGIPTHAGALDFNLGCSGFVYGLGLAQALVLSGQASRVLLITAETYSKFIHPQDKSVRTLFGDAASAAFITPAENDMRASCPAAYIYGTDGSGAENLIVPAGGMRRARSEATAQLIADDNGNARSLDNLHMNGAEIFNFTLRVIPDCVQRLLIKAGRALDDVDLFVFHQANQYMLEHLRKKLKVPPEKFYIHLHDCGNTVSSTIPIALKHASEEGKLRRGQSVMLVGFGVGYSWGAILLEWPYLALAERSAATFKHTEARPAVSPVPRII